MAISKETESFLSGLESQGKLPKEVIAQLRSAAEASTDSDNYIKGSVLRQEDYSRNIADVKAAQKAVEDSQRALQQKESDVSRYQAELGQWKAGADVNFNKALQEREKAEAKSAQAFAKLKTIADASGLNYEDVIKDLEVTPVENKPNTNTPQFDASKYVTVEQVNTVTSQAALLDATIHDIGESHRELFGTRINAKELVTEALKAGRPLEEYWKEKFKVDDKVKENGEKAVQARIDAAVLERETSLRSQLQLPAPRAGRETNPYNAHQIFENMGIKKAAETDNSGGVSAAIAAFNSGKYSQKFGG